MCGVRNSGYNLLMTPLRGAASEGLRDPEHGAPVVVAADRDIGPVLLDEAASIGREAAILQPAVEHVHGEARLPICTCLPEQRVLAGMTPPAHGDPGRDRKAAPKGMGDPEGQSAEPAAAATLAGIDMFEVDVGPKRRSGIERVVEAGAQGHSPTIQPGILRMLATFRGERDVDPKGWRQAQVSSSPRHAAIAYRPRPRGEPPGDGPARSPAGDVDLGSPPDPGHRSKLPDKHIPGIAPTCATRGAAQLRQACALPGTTSPAPERMSAP